MPIPGTPASSSVDYVFGYGSLVALQEQLVVEGAAFPAVEGRLRGFRRLWNAAMNNWEEASDPKHWIDAETGERPRVRVAYLDIEPTGEGAVGDGTVNGLAIPAGPSGLAALDRREVNYTRIDVSTSFEPVSRQVQPQPFPDRVFAYRATDAARSRCRAGAAASNICVSTEYIARVRSGFAALGPDALAEFDRTTEPLPFPQMDLKLIWRERSID